MALVIVTPRAITFHNVCINVRSEILRDINVSPAVVDKGKGILRFWHRKNWLS